ncbi:hypothetical protein H8356DRAFT_1346452 [Neocallimastix lanati (nom. inval.)]|nr:hypothetical protein H8356DRAFT_1346452 [Neocallimastix sp. JGI-2020a]
MDSTHENQIELFTILKIELPRVFCSTTKQIFEGGCQINEEMLSREMDIFNNNNNTIIIKSDVKTQYMRYSHKYRWYNITLQEKGFRHTKCNKVQEIIDVLAEQQQQHLIFGKCLFKPFRILSHVNK